MSGIADPDCPAIPDEVDAGVVTCPKSCGKKEFVRPAPTDKTESDLEDIVIDGIARKRPTTIRYLCSFRRHLEVGVPYRWCACGKSADVLCDDSCGPLDLAPLEFKLGKAVTWNSLCGCRYTSAPPFCDGQHFEPQVGQDEYAEEHGLPLPPACADWLKQKAALLAAKKAARGDAVPTDAFTVPRPAGCSGSCARARRFAAAGITESAAEGVAELPDLEDTAQ